MAATFEQWSATRVFQDDLSMLVPGMGLENIQGYAYMDGSQYIFVHDTEPKQYDVLIGNTEESFTDLAEAEKYLWDNWACDFYQ